MKPKCVDTEGRWMQVLDADMDKDTMYVPVPWAGKLSLVQGGCAYVRSTTSECASAHFEILSSTPADKPNLTKKVLQMHLADPTNLFTKGMLIEY